VGNPSVSRRRIEKRLVRHAVLDGGLHRVVHIEDHAFRRALAVPLFVDSADDGEGVQAEVDVVAKDAVEMEKRGVEFAAEVEASLLVPAEGRAVMAAIAGEGSKVPGGVDEFQDAWEEPGL